MAMVINTNLASINGQRKLHDTQGSQSTAMERLSSGLRVNAAKDDAAGLAIADRMNSQIRGMTVAIRNANDGVSLVQTAEGALGSMSDTLQRMRDLAVQASSNAGVTQSDRTKMQAEFKQLNDELTRIVQNTEFNGKKVLNGDLAAGLNIQVGANTDSANQIKVKVSDMSASLTNVTNSTLDPGSVVDTAIKNDATATTLLAAKVAAEAKAAQSAQAAAANPTDVALLAASQTDSLAAATAGAAYKTQADTVTAALTTDVIANLIGERNVDGTINTAGPVSQSIFDLVQAKILAGTAYDTAFAASDAAAGKSQADIDTAKASYIAKDAAVLTASRKADSAAASFALQSIERIDASIAQIDAERANLGAVQNRFTTTVSNLQTSVENQSAAKSRIMDADFATETANLSRTQILQQAGTAMLAQANQSGQSVMTLLR